MASRVWLLVQWMEEARSIVVPSYSVVSVDTLSYDVSKLYIGNFIFVRENDENPRRAKILQISESRRYLQERLEALERLNHKMMEFCKQTVKDLKLQNLLKAQRQPATNIPLSDVDSSDSDGESNVNYNVKYGWCITDSNYRPVTPEFNLIESFINQVQGSLNALNSRRRSIISSTPLPSSSAQENTKLCFDQATQTEELFVPISKLEEIQEAVKELYKRFQAFVAHVNEQLGNGSICLSESEHNEEFLHFAPNDSGIEFVEEVGAEEGVEDKGGEQQLNSSMVRTEEEFSPYSNTLRVRRMSAQTTNNIEILNDVDMVPIGNGKAEVPARLLNDIDWNSYTSATRQLLQAIFPRRVLATHSLTGKQSPAFLNRPAKKILDPQLVDDIVKTVSTKCGVPKNLVRNSITTKCTDEAKLFRSRQKSGRKLRARKSRLQQSDENVPPYTASSDESHGVFN